VLCFAYLQHLSVGPYVPKCSKRSALQPLPHQLVPGILTDVAASDLVLRRRCAGPERVDGFLKSKFLMRLMLLSFSIHPHLSRLSLCNSKIFNFPQINYDFYHGPEIYHFQQHKEFLNYVGGVLYANPLPWKISLIVKERKMI